MNYLEHTAPILDSTGNVMPPLIVNPTIYTPVITVEKKEVTSKKVGVKAIKIALKKSNITTKRKKTKKKSKTNSEKIDLAILDCSVTEQLFARNYLFGTKEYRMGNAQRSYADAFSKDMKNKKDANTSGVLSHRLLKKVKIRAFMKQTLEDAGFNDEIVDSRLLDVIIKGEDKHSVVAIREYNKLQSRIEEKVKHSFDKSNLLTEEQLQELLTRKKNDPNSTNNSLPPATTTTS